MGFLCKYITREISNWIGESDIKRNTQTYAYIFGKRKCSFLFISTNGKWQLILVLLDIDVLPKHKDHLQSPLIGERENVCTRDIKSIGVCIH